ncbi:MAG: hypothetical protein Q4P78_04630 [Rothia sp. (in: high G+C Gram-positive bacteria)]|uniref:hypothetical protein n=1 Tax=Rothia sp. (in: high G+C Gram-positive bacteria) TaxID=1885016 RepID=UPI0026DF6532|nr:hypothetical protein [Rothia sp. (in: high G+C Gram-positive bacteria)]MDO5750476.1 hypothetical protein [Rothia sp. (in: high G+C Gram-positive bacteria)]
MMHKISRSIVSWGAILIGLVAGCAAPQPTQSENITLHSSESISPAGQSQRGAADKVNELTRTPEIVNTSYQKASRECMVSKGYEARSEYYFPHIVKVRSLVIPRPLSTETARSSGYGTLPGKTKGSDTGYEMSNEESTAFYGDGSDDFQPCQDKVLNELFGPRDVWEYYVTLEDYLIPYVNAFVSSEQSRKINEDWSQCMAEKSYSFAGPGVAMMQTYNTPEAQEVAIADALCREQIRYEERISEGLDVYMTTFLQDNPALIERVSQARKNAEQNAPKMLNGAS